MPGNQSPDDYKRTLAVRIQQVFGVRVEVSQTLRCEDNGAFYAYQTRNETTGTQDELQRTQMAFHQQQQQQQLYAPGGMMMMSVR